MLASNVFECYIDFKFVYGETFMKYWGLIIFGVAFIWSFAAVSLENDFGAMKNAIEKNDLSATDSLISQGFDVNTRDENGNPPLHYALLKNRVKIAKKLIEAGANVNAPSSESGITPLLIVTEKAKQLQQKAKKILAKNEGYTQSRSAEIKLQKYIISQMNAAKKLLEILIANGADVNQKTPYGTPLMSAACNEWNIDLIDILLKSGAKVNERDNNGRTALFYAEIFGGDEISTKLLSAGADIDIKDYDGKSYMELTKKDFAE